MKPGIYSNAELSNDEYHGGPGVSSTTLKELISRSPAHCLAMMDGLRRKFSDAMSLGTVIHAAVLEPETFDSLYFVEPSREDFPDALDSSGDYLYAAEKAGLDLTSKTSKAEIRPLLEDADPGLVFWEDLAAAAPTKAGHPEALDSLADYKEAAKAAGFTPTGKAKKADIRKELDDAGVAAVYWEDLAATIPVKADYPDAIDSVADHKAAAERLGIDLASKTTKADIRAALENAGADVVFMDDLLLPPEGKTAISPLQADAAIGAVTSIEADADASFYLTGGVAEQSFVWVDKATGELCKVRTDYYRETDGVIVDLKTCEDARPAAVARSISNYGYDVSAAMYMDGVAGCGKPADQFVWVFVETTAPFAVRCYLASDALLSRAREKYHGGLEQFSACRDAENWPAYPGGLVEIDIPAYARGQSDINEVV